MRTIYFNKLRKNTIMQVKKRLLNTCLNELNNLDIINKYIKFNSYETIKVVKNVDLDNIKFKGINFECIEFENCSFENCIFINCKFKIARFINCNMQNIIFKDLSINEIIIENSNLKKSIFSNCDIDDITFKDCNLKSFKLIESSICKFEFDDSLVSKFDEDTFFDKLDIKDKEGNYKFYRAIAYKFQQNNLLNHHGEYFYLYKIMERKTLKGINKFKSYALWLICGYGERPTYALITSLEIIFIFTILYMIFGLSLENEIISYKEIYLANKPLSLVIDDFIRSFHFSIVTFTTVGYGDITPIGYSILLSGIQMFLGVTMVGIWTATLARKINR